MHGPWSCGIICRGRGNPLTNYRFTGQRQESALGGLYDYGARFYDPLLGRFISADTIVPQAGHPQALNRYAYVRNNPLARTDPTGHFPLLLTIGAGAVIGGVAGAAAYAGSIWLSSGGINGGNLDKFDAGECLAVAATGAIAGGLIGSGVGAPAGIGVAGGGGGYLVVNGLTGGDFDTVDFGIASGLGGITGGVGSTLEFGVVGTVALGGISGIDQYGLTEVRHGRTPTAEGMFWAMTSGAAGGFIDTKLPSRSVVMRGIPISQPLPLKQGWMVKYGSEVTVKNPQFVNKLFGVVWRSSAATFISNSPDLFRSPQNSTPQQYYTLQHYKEGY